MKKAVSVLATFMMVASVRGWGGVFNREGKALKKIVNLGFWLKLGGGGV